MVFVADDLAAWLTGALADAGRKKLTMVVLGTDQERALRSAATAAVRHTAAEVWQCDGERAAQLAMVVSEVFGEPAPGAPLAGHATLLEELQAGIAGQLAVLDDASLTGTGRSSAAVLEVPGAVLAQKLTGHLVREIVARGSRGGALFPLASQLNQDVTHLQGQRLEGILGQLTGEVREALARMDSAFAVAATPAERIRHQVCDANPRSLGVHAAIEVPGALDELPRYVPRDIDERLRATLRSGVGFVLLVGSSSVGKTRCAYEAVLAELPDWWLFHPRDAAELDTFAAAPIPHTVIWLDEIERYLSGGLSASTVRVLLNAHHPTPVVGTLWPEAYHRFLTPPSAGVRQDPFSRQRELLNLASVLVVSPVLSIAERDRAHATAATDPRLAVTLTSGYGMTQALAAAPELIRRWEAAPNAHTWALIAAAADARRVGVRSPLPVALLRAAVPGYLTQTERAKAPINWFEAALGYAATELHGAAALLDPVAVEMGAPTGYALADYVYEHALRTRSIAVPPQTAWNAYAEHLTDYADLLSAGEAAQDRMLYREAKRLYRSAGAEGLAALALLQQRTGRSDEAQESWRAAIAVGDTGSASWLAGALAGQHRYDEAEQVLRDAIEAGLDDGHSRLGSFLKDRGRFDEAEQVLREGMATKDPVAWFSLADVLEKVSRLDEAEQVLREAMATGLFEELIGDGGGPRYWLTQLLYEQNRYEDAEQIWRDAVAHGEPEARYWLATQLSIENRLDEAEEVWRDAVGANERSSRYQLSWLLVDQDRVDEALMLWQGAIALGESDAHTGMATVLQRLGRTIEAEQAPRDAIAAGERNAHSELASFLLSQGRTTEAEQSWRDAIAAGENQPVYGGLVHLLKNLGREEEAHQIARYGFNPDGSIAQPQTPEKP